jgi:hypothetical protein
MMSPRGLLAEVEQRDLDEQLSGRESQGFTPDWFPIYPSLGQLSSIFMTSVMGSANQSRA